jgi:hypothetical protein
MRVQAECRVLNGLPVLVEGRVARDEVEVDGVYTLRGEAAPWAEKRMRKADWYRAQEALMDAARRF